MATPFCPSMFPGGLVTAPLSPVLTLPGHTTLGLGDGVSALVPTPGLEPPGVCSVVPAPILPTGGVATVLASPHAISLPSLSSVTVGGSTLVYSLLGPCLATSSLSTGVMPATTASRTVAVNAQLPTPQAAGSPVSATPAMEGVSPSSSLPGPFMQLVVDSP